MPKVVRYREIRPCPRLRPFIDSFWILEHDGEDAAPQRVVPDGHPELILNWSHPLEAFEAGQWRGQPPYFFAGQIEGPLLLRPNGPAKMLGIRFHPHGAASLLAHPMHELKAKFTPMEDLSPALSRDLDRALDSREPIPAVEAALLSAVNNSANCDRIVAEAVRRITLAKGATDLSALAHDLGVSVRQLERRFQAAVGLPPKLFAACSALITFFASWGSKRPTGWTRPSPAATTTRPIRFATASLTGNTPAILLAEDVDLARHFLVRFGVSHTSNTWRRGSV
jgi:AraC-like DNA-binding protein